MVCLLTHNILRCRTEQCTHFPLSIQSPTLETIERQPNNESLMKMLPRLDWNVLKSACSEVRNDDTMHVSLICADILWF